MLAKVIVVMRIRLVYMAFDCVADGTDSTGRDVKKSAGRALREQS